VGQAMLPRTPQKATEKVIMRLFVVIGLSSSEP
jgi:hypothetical protein